MTLEGLIEYEENASKATWNGKPTLCAEEHRQLAEWLKDYKRLLAQQPCGDCISRQAVLDQAVYTVAETGWCGMTVDVKDIESLPPVTTAKKVGQWIFVFRNGFGRALYKCSECNFDYDATGYNYCPNCGAWMKLPKSWKGE